jgi:acetylornithine deacetylase/succinyl-diaminopimelate desuccinylase family protein
MPTDRADAAAAAVDADEVLAIAQALIRARSENPGTTEDAAAEVATGVLLGLGAVPDTVRGDAGRPSVVATIGGDAGPSLAWNGHLDTVPAGSLDTWSVDPFAGEVVDGRLIGRGASDMKGPVAAALVGAAAVVHAGVELAGSLTFHLVADEELAGTHGTQVLRDRGLLTQDAAIVGEPSNLEIALAERGGAWVTATTYGAAAHGSQPHRGVNAITAMARFLIRLHEVIPDTVHPLCGRATVNAALIEGGSAPNMVPDRCVVDIDRRTIPGESDPEKVLAPFRSLADDLKADDPTVDLRTEIREWILAAESPADTPIAEAIRTATADQTGAVPPDVGFTGITDARFYLNDAAIPTVIFGPGDLAVAHTANESIGVEDLITGARTYARIFASFLGA